MAIVKTPTYSIFINESSSFQDEIARLNPSRVFVLVDSITEQYCLYRILEELPESSIIINIEPGESRKNIDTCQFIWQSLLNNGADRQALVLNLGGGVIGDMGGFCASTYMRGIRFIQMPTTLLSQVDSSVGSKLGIDFQNVKNIIGVFQDPQSVIINTSFLKSLPYKQLLSGYAEVLKHALIQDKEMWDELKGKTDLTQLDYGDLIYRNVSLKNKVVVADPREKGLRKILNFGHTIGHAIETLLLETEDRLLHGEAIAIGMICEAYLSYLKGYLSSSEVDEIKNTFITLYGNKHKSLPELKDLTSIMLLDKKNRDGKIMFSLLNKIGEGNFDQELTLDQVNESLMYYSRKL
jgi:3-dehydroquinate synthase